MTLVFNPPCITPPTRADVARGCERSPVASKFVTGRQINEHTDEVVEVVMGPNEPLGVAGYVEAMWRRSFGGTLPMRWQPPDGRPAFDVRFARRPQFTISQDNAKRCTVRVQLEKRII